MKLVVIGGVAGGASAATKVQASNKFWSRIAGPPPESFEELKDIIKDQSNAKEILRASEFEKLSFIAKPNLKILGPKRGRAHV